MHMQMNSDVIQSWMTARAPASLAESTLQWDEPINSCCCKQSY